MKPPVTIIAAILITLLCWPGISLAENCETDESCTETGLFTNVAPEAMIVLDLSGSMKWNPPGDHDSWNNPTYEYSDPTCAGPFYDDNWHSGYTTYCSRFEIARKTLFNMLDDNHNGTIDSQDETSLNIRIGLGQVPGQHLHEAARHRDEVLPHLLRQQHLLHRRPVHRGTPPASATG